ncbi:uncharacterized protein LODBEIA_P15280 [Lodderomyces beijingensis]|uniref:Mtf2-like C-terminal domain-containing protein n=1 Tax=Lodderomyces beijingensis TaxID=1775926 RepID=A0ABP0ZGL5_9ASCO
MVLRSLASGVVSRIPIVNKFSRSSENSATTTPQISPSQQTQSDQLSIYTSASDENSSDFEDNGEVKPIFIKNQYRSPKEKLHLKIISNRARSATTSPDNHNHLILNHNTEMPAPTSANSNPATSNELSDSDIWLGSPSKRRNVSSIDRSNIRPVSTRLSKRRNGKVNSSDSFEPEAVSSSGILRDGSASAMSNSSTGSGLAEDDTLSEDRARGSASGGRGEENRMGQYLNDQNDKFNELITNNIDVVLNPEQVQAQQTQEAIAGLVKSSTPNEVLFKMAYDNKGAIASSIYQFGKNQLSARLPHIPYFNNKKKSKPIVEEVVTDVETDVESNYESTSEKRVLGSPMSSPSLLPTSGGASSQQIVEYDPTASRLTQSCPVDQRDFDQLMANLDDEVKIDIFLDSLDTKTKVNLYQSLRKDLQVYDGASTSSVKNIYYDESISTIDKIQIFIIISVKLLMTGIKLFVPITKYIIYKFQNNELFIINSKNVNRFIDFVLRFMSYLDMKLNSNEDFIERVSQHDYVKAEENLEEFYNDFTSRTRNYLKPSAIKNRLLAKDDFFTRGVYDYMIGTTPREKNYRDDPEYAMYYSNKRAVGNGGGESIAESVKATISNGSVSGSDSRGSSKSTSFASLEARSKGNSSSNSSAGNSNNDVSFIEVADRFIQQLEKGA